MIRRRFGFTIVEILVALSIIVLLVTAVSVGYRNFQVRSRDANRRDSLSGYRVAMEQYKSANGFYVIDTKNGVQAYDSSGNPLPSLISVGYSGQGWGRLTRKTAVGGPTLVGYGTASIADSLVQHGFLSTIRSDPSLSNFNSDLDSASATRKTQDFYLTVCTSTGTAVTNATPKLGLEYTLYAKLESPSTNDAAAAAIGSRCPAPAGDVAVSGSTFNYAVGSTTF